MSSSNLPVLVYFHGGAFIVGSNQDVPLQPEHLGMIANRNLHQSRQSLGIIILNHLKSMSKILSWFK